MYYVFLIGMSIVAVLTGCLSGVAQDKNNAAFVLLGIIAAACIDVARTLRQKP